MGLGGMRQALMRILPAAALAMFAVISGAVAQDITPDMVQSVLKNASPEQREELKKRGFSTQGTSQTQGPVVLEPAEPARKPSTTERSLLEKVLSERSGHALRQFGYDQVGVGASVTVPQTGAVQDEYVLGPGDKLDVTLRGQENSQYSLTVDRGGSLALPKTGPVMAAGKTLAQFRKDLSSAVQRAYVSTQTYVSVSELRQVTVMVAGEVANPGMRILTGLSNPLDAVLLSGGVKKSGSLRAIRLVRQGKTITVDLYGVLTRQATAPLVNLQDGDRILVPPIGATVAVAGYIRRPAIYELPAGREAMSARELTALGSGTVLRGTTTASVLRILPDGKARFVDVSGQPGASVRDGEVLIVKAAVAVSTGRVRLVGAVRTPGDFAVDKYRTLHSILSSSEALTPGAYVLFGFIDRIDPHTLQHEAVPFSPLHVVDGRDDVPLASEDTVYVLTKEAMLDVLHGGEPLPKETAGAKTTIFGEIPRPADARGQDPRASEARGPNARTSEARKTDVRPADTRTSDPRASDSGAPLDARSSNSRVSDSRRSEARAAEFGATGGEFNDTASDEAKPADTKTQAEVQLDAANDALDGIGEKTRKLFGPKLSDYPVGFGGALQKPGTYLIAPGTSLAEALKVLGGLSDDVDLTSFEMTSIIIDNHTGISRTDRRSIPATPDKLASILLMPYDQIDFGRVYSDRDSGGVTIEGQVRKPGQYPILRSERLSSVLRRAGGLTEVAYPYGTVFLRQSVAEQQAQQLKKTAADIRSQLFALLMRPSSAGAPTPSAETVVALQNMLTDVENQPALGRIAILGDPDKFARDPQNDPVLQTGDRIFIPKQPTSVSVMGEVMNPGAFPQDPNLTIDDYIEQAGGFTQFADESRVIVVLPDGRARIEGSTWLSFGGRGDLPPGSMVVVSRDVSGVSFRQWLIDSTQIFTQLATTAAALAVLSTNMK
jgi:protein involved in polysaccharide export with SLBB domain